MSTTRPAPPFPFPVTSRQAPGMLRERRVFAYRRRPARAAPQTAAASVHSASDDSSASSQESLSPALATLMVGLERTREPDERIGLLMLEREESESAGGSYDFRSIVPTDETSSNESEIQFYTDSDYEDEDDDDHGEEDDEEGGGKEKDSQLLPPDTPVVTPPQASRRSSAIDAHETPPDVAAAPERDILPVGESEADFATALTLVTTMLDTHPRLRELYLARFRDDDTRAIELSIPSSKTLAPLCPQKVSVPSAEVWLLLAFLVGAVAALEGLAHHLAVFLEWLAGAAP